MPDLPEYTKLARQLRRRLRHTGDVYGKAHSLATGEPEFDPKGPSAAWLEWRGVTHFGISNPANRLRDAWWCKMLARQQDSHEPDDQDHADAWRH